MSISSVSSFSSMQRPDPAQMRAKLFLQADTDGNGTISKDEWKIAMKNAPQPPDAPEGVSAPSADEMFAKIDSDGDGEITKTEMAAADQAREEEMKARSGQGGAGIVGGFAGSTDLMQGLLDALKADDSTSASATSVSANTETAKQEALKALLAHLQEKKQSYMANGANQSASGTSLFRITV
jgi:hypothetical protein